MGKHNKKRNVGLIYEQLLRQISVCLVEKNDEKMQKIQKILKNHFKPGTELYKEFRLFNALAKTTLPSESLATRVLEEAKKAAKNCDAKKLTYEKSILIKAINHSLNDAKFYNQKVPEYREYATIQVLLNGWRSDSDIAKITEYETKVYSMLLTEKNNNNLKDEVNEDINRLTVKIMLEKFNKKYGTILNKEQVNMVQKYAFLSHKEMSDYLQNLKHKTVLELKRYKSNCKNQVLLEKIDKVMKNVQVVNELAVDDDSIAKFLLISKLKEEISESSNER